MTEDLIKIETNGKEFQLTPQIVKQYICPKATGQEIYTFLQLCKAQNLNPFIREVYLVKYSDKQPASMVTGKETFLKRAMKNPKYKGHRAWVNLEKGQDIKEMTAMAEVYVEGYQVPISVTVDYEEYVAMKKDFNTGKMVPNSMWASKPKTMLRKVALMQALREAFPDDLGGLYDSSEINTINSDELPTTIINADATVVEEKKEEPKKKTTRKKDEQKPEPVEEKKEEPDVDDDSVDADFTEVEEQEEAEEEGFPEPEEAEDEVEEQEEPVEEKKEEPEVDEDMVDADFTEVEEQEEPVEEKKEEPITKKQLSTIHLVVDKLRMPYEHAREILKDKYGVTSSKELTKKQASDAIKYFNELTGEGNI